MNEALALSRLATKLLRDLEDIADSCEDDSAVHSQSIEVILDAFSNVEVIISSGKEPDEEPGDAARSLDDEGSVN